MAPVTPYGKPTREGIRPDRDWGTVPIYQQFFNYYYFKIIVAGAPAGIEERVYIHMRLVVESI